jgi:hypothetical protein
MQKPTPDVFDADRATLKAIEGLSDYQLVNPAYSTSGLQQLNATLATAQGRH